VADATPEIIKELIKGLDQEKIWDKENLQIFLKNFARKQDIKFPVVAQPIRIALIGSSHGPGIFEMMEILGIDETFKRLQKLSLR